MLAPATVMFVHCLSVGENTTPADTGVRPFEMRLVQAQLDSMCVLPSILWQRFGYPISMPMVAFWDRCDPTL